MKFVQITSEAEAFAAATEWTSTPPLERLIQMAFRAGCRTVVALDDGKCSEWQEEFDILFRDIAHRLQGEPVLLLFPRGKADNEGDILKALSTPGGVVGYAILRPSPLESVAEALIVAGPISDTHFITCQAQHTLQLPGDEPREINMRGLPFMQQDRMVTSCAHASLWIATRLITGAFPEWPNCGVVTCKRAADALQFQHTPFRFGRKLPTMGLFHDEIMLILEREGYDPVSYRFLTESEKNKADHTVYRWVESGIPVILLVDLELGGHSVVICGHTFDPDAWWPGARRDYFPSLASDDLWYSSSLWAVQYLVIDDNYGPALAMTRGSLRNRSSVAIVPLPRAAKIYLLPEDAEGVAAAILFSEGIDDGLKAILEQGPDVWVERLRLALREQRDKLVLRTFLVPSNDVVQHLQGTPSYASQTRRLVQRLTLPDKVWLVEISIPSIYGDKLKLGEALLDPQVPSKFMRTGLEPLLWLHLPGLVWSPSQLGLGALAVGGEAPAALLRRAVPLESNSAPSAPPAR